MTIVAVGCGGLILLGCLLSIGLVTFVGLQPTTSMQTESGLPEADRVAIQALLLPGEKIVYAVTRGVTDFSEETSCLTDQRALAWMNYHDPITVRSIAYDDIASLTVLEASSFMDSSHLRVESSTDAVLILYAPSDELELKRFANYIRQRIPTEPAIAEGAEAPDAGEPAQLEGPPQE